MTRIFWDTHLFLYLFEGGKSAEDVRRLRERMVARGDHLLTSSLTLAEILVRPAGAGAEAADKYERAVTSAATILPFDAACARRYAALRDDRSLSPADALQLSCAGAAGIDLFVTHDDRLSAKVVPGVKFITSLERAFL